VEESSAELEVRHDLLNPAVGRQTGCRVAGRLFNECSELVLCQGRSDWFL